MSTQSPSASGPNTDERIEVRRADLPVSCPTEGMGVWNSHPTVFIPVEETGSARCPYCGAQFVLAD